MQRAAVSVLVVVTFCLLALGSEDGDRRVTPPHSDYASPVESPPETWRHDLEVTSSNWSKSEFGVATWTVAVKNKSSTTAYKDIHFKTDYYASSGTKVDESIIGHTEFIKIKANSKATIRFDEFTHSQARRASIAIDGAKVAD